MKCKYCKATDLPDHSRFCPWCGKKLQADAAEIKVPPPKQLPSGTWFNRITVDGERVSVSAATQEEYFTKARAAKAGLIDVKKALPKMTVGDAVDKFIESNSKILSPSTIKAYKSYRKHRFQKLMGRDVGSKINWQAAVNEECVDCSAKTVANAWRLITVSLRAQGREVPAVALPKLSKAERPWLDYEQIQAFLKAVNGQDCELPALLALHGLRRSELLALTADKVDLEKELITVSGASVYNDKGEFVQKETNKNASSQRTVHIVIPRLLALLEGADGLLVTTKPNTTYVQVNRVCEAVGLPKVGVHGLRHSFASLAYHLGWSEATTMREGGWSNSKTVHEIYTHLAAQDANEDIKRMKDFYKAAAKNGNENANESKKSLN